MSACSRSSTSLKRGVDILVATPGRLLDHHGQRTLDLSHVQIFVLDEADRMLDMGFIHDIKKVLAALPKKKQSLLFSATFSDEIKDLADRLLNQPALIEVARRNAPAELVAQRVHPVSRDRKKELLAHLILQGDWHQVLVFTRTKHGANKLTEYLDRNHISAMAIHGNKSQGARTKALADFKSGELRVLVATDIAARGIDIDQLPHVVNYELPNVPEDYVHRIGRTGRAGASGEAISLACVDEEIFLRDIQRLIRKEIPREVVKGFEPDPTERAEPILLGRMTIGVGGNRRNGNGGRPARPPQGRAPTPLHPSRSANPLQGTHAPRDARAPQGQKPAQGPRPGARSGRQPAWRAGRRQAAPRRPRPLSRPPHANASGRPTAPFSSHANAVPRPGLHARAVRQAFASAQALAHVQPHPLPCLAISSLAVASSFLPSKLRLFMSATHSSSTEADSLMNS